MPLELEQPVATVNPEAAISALLCLFHACVSRDLQQASPRLAQQLYFHLEGLSRRHDLPEVLRSTCDELSDAWQSRVPGLRGSGA